MQDLANMNQDELIALVENLRNKKGGNKEATLKILQESESWLTLQDIADQLSISKNNVSSQLTPIRKAGHVLIEYNDATQGKLIKLIDTDQATQLGI